MAGVDYIKVNEGLHQEVQDLELNQFLDSVNINKFLSIFADVATEIEELYVALSEAFLIENAEGVQLDIIGELLGVDRNGADDETYRGKMAVAIAGLASNGSRDSIVRMVELVTGATPSVFKGLYHDIYLYIKESCYEPSEIGPDIGQYFPLNTQGMIVVTPFSPFGYEGDDEAFGYGSVVTPPGEIASEVGHWSSRVFLSVPENAEQFLYLLDSNVVNAIGIEKGFNRPLINIDGFRHMAIESVNPSDDIFYLSARGDNGTDNVERYYSGNGSFDDFSSPTSRFYYEITPTSVMDYPIGKIQHVATFGSVVNGAIDTPGDDNILTITYTLDCTTTVPEVTLVIRNDNQDGTYSSATYSYSGLTENLNVPMGIYIDVLGRMVGVTRGGVDLGIVEADESTDAVSPIGSPITWVDIRARNGNFYMNGQRTTDPLQQTGDNISLRWDYAKEHDFSLILTNTTDIFGRLL